MFSDRIILIKRKFLCWPKTTGAMRAEEGRSREALLSNSRSHFLPFQQQQVKHCVTKGSFKKCVTLKMAFFYPYLPYITLFDFFL